MPDLDLIKQAEQAVRGTGVGGSPALSQPAAPPLWLWRAQAAKLNRCLQNG
jgi:hypothetical protein